jgi:flagellar biosynthetic protein FliO
MEALCKFLVISIIALLLCALSSPSVFAQQSSVAAKTADTPAAAPQLTTDNKKPEPSQEPSVASTADAKATDDRLPFMAENERESHDQAPSGVGLLLRTFGALLLIVGLIVAAAWGMKRFGGARFGTPQEDAPELAVMNSISLGDRRSLAIVRFGERTLLLGSTAQAVTLIAETEIDSFAPQMRSVADILSDDERVAFAYELSSASQRLEDGMGAWQGDSDPL